MIEIRRCQFRIHAVAVVLGVVLFLLLAWLLVSPGRAEMLQPAAAPVIELYRTAVSPVAQGRPICHPEPPNPPEKTPEPATWVLMAAALAVIVAGRLWRASRDLHADGGEA